MTFPEKLIYMWKFLSWFTRICSHHSETTKDVFSRLGFVQVSALLFLFQPCEDMRHGRNLTSLQPQRAQCQLLGNRYVRQGLRWTLCPALCWHIFRKGSHCVFQSWPGAHNEQVEANSFSSIGEGRIKMGLLFPSSASQRRSTFSWKHIQFLVKLSLVFERPLCKNDPISGHISHLSGINL